MRSRAASLGANDPLNSARTRYREIRAAKDGLLRLLAIEDKLDLVLQNYAEFEHELLLIALQDIVHGFGDWSASRADMLSVNRRLVNLTSSCRLYIDQVKHDLSDQYGPASAHVERAEKAFSREYDSRLGYRVMEDLRNHIQHRSMPVHLLKRGWSRDEDSPAAAARFSFVPYVSVSRLADEGAFKPRVVEELRAGDDSLDLRPIVREYVASVSRVHKEVREMTKADLSGWEKVIIQTRQRSRATYGDDLIGLAVVRRADDQVVESTDIFEDLVTRRQQLQRKHPCNTDYRLCFVSSEVVPPKV